MIFNFYWVEVKDLKDVWWAIAKVCFNCFLKQIDCWGDYVLFIKDGQDTIKGETLWNKGQELCSFFYNYICILINNLSSVNLKNLMINVTDIQIVVSSLLFIYSSVSVRIKVSVTTVESFSMRQPQLCSRLWHHRSCNNWIIEK